MWAASVVLSCLLTIQNFLREKCRHGAEGTLYLPWWKPNALLNWYSDEYD